MSSTLTAGRDPAERRGRTLDRWIPVILTLGTALYVAAWPRDLFPADEGLLLYEAKRILAGDIVYRDFFEVITPLSLYLIAGLFWLFGASMETARLSNAGLHTLIVLTIYALCRRLGVRRAVAVVAALAHVSICYAALPITSAHWLGTLLNLLILLLVLDLPTPPHGWRLLAVGAVTGTLIAAQQQKGAVIAAGVAIVLIIDALAEGGPGRAVRLVKRLAWFGGGTLAVVAPMMIALIAAAGFEPVFDALVRFPLIAYPAYNRRHWGAYHPNLPDWYVYPELIKYLPRIVPVTFLRLVWSWWRLGYCRRTRQLMVLSIMGWAVIVSILYFPDYIHLSIIAPVMFVLVADAGEAILGFAEQTLRVPRPAGLLLCAALCIVLGQRAYKNIVTRRRLYPLSHITAFGRVDFRNETEIQLVDKIRELLQDAPEREIFCYTSCPGLYLTTDTENPTPYQLMIPGYNRPEQLNEVVEILERRKVPYVVAIRVAIKSRVDDPIWTYYGKQYGLIPIGTKPQLVYGLFKRKE